MKLSLIITATLLCLNSVVPTLFGAAFYVDFESGSDANSGTSTGSAWRTIPGTRTTGGSAYRSTNWGAISTGNKIQPGSTIQLKLGTTHNGSNGGYVWIGADLYAQNASKTNPILIQAANSWGTGSVTFDAQSMTVPIAVLLVQVDGVTIDGVTPDGMIIKNSELGGIQVKEKAGTGNPIADCTLQYLKFQHNVTSASNDFEGSGSAQLAVRNAAGLLVNQVVCDGSNQWCNAMIFGETQKSATDALVKNCTAYNHQGNDDCGIGFKAFNSQIVFSNCTSYSNYKGFDLGEQSGQNRNIYYTVDHSRAYSNSFGANFNVFGANSYTGAVTNYLINSLVYDNTNVGANIYAGPMVMIVANCTFSHNGFGGTYPAGERIHLSFSPEYTGGVDDTSVMKGYFYNNAFVNGYAGTFLNYWFSPAANNFSLDIDYNGYVQTNGFFWRWSYSYGPQAVDFDYGAYGPGHTTGGWYTNYSANATAPASGTGHFHCDANSKGTGCAITNTPPFVNASANNYQLTANYAGVDLSSKPWYISAMGTDLNGRQRVNWDIGAYEHTSVLPQPPSAPTDLTVVQP